MRGWLKYNLYFVFQWCVVSVKLNIFSNSNGTPHWSESISENMHNIRFEFRFYLEISKSISICVTETLYLWLFSNYPFQVKNEPFSIRYKNEMTMLNTCWTTTTFGKGERNCLACILVNREVSVVEIESKLPRINNNLKWSDWFLSPGMKTLKVKFSARISNIQPMFSCIHEQWILYFFHAEITPSIHTNPWTYYPHSKLY